MIRPWSDPCHRSSQESWPTDWRTGVVIERWMRVVMAGYSGRGRETPDSSYAWPRTRQNAPACLGQTAPRGGQAWGTPQSGQA